MNGDMANAGAGREPSTSLPQEELRILILAPTRNDAPLTARFLQEAGYEAAICRGLEDLGEDVLANCGALLIAEEALAGDFSALAATLERQPFWSDLPLILIASAGTSAHVRPRCLEMLRPIGNITIVERPVRPETLVSVCEVALRSRRHQYQVRELLRERDEAHRRKDEFLAMLAHELRNPLAAIANAATLLSAGSAEDREWARGVITRQSSHLARLIDDLLDVSRLTSGKIQLRKELIDAATILDRVRDSTHTLLQSRGHELICNYVSGCFWIEADPARLEQILLNLVTNAAKYTPNGGRIELSAQIVDGEVHLTVADNGIGIAPERLPEMFELFTQGERSIARSEGGLGIGLTIVRKLVEMHGGRVEAHSDGPNRGSTFTACFPVARTETYRDAESRATPTPETAAQRVLVVDDNIDSAQSMARVLARAGHEVSLAHTGTEALEKAREHFPGTVLLDIGLPGMDGYEVARRLRAEAPGEEMLIIAVTGYGQPEDRQKCLEAGCDHHLIKPVNFGELKRLLEERPVLAG